MTVFKLDQYDVLLDDGKGGYAEHHVIVFHADELAAEIEAPKYGLSMQVKTDDEGNTVPDLATVRGQHLVALNVWAALKRMKAYGKAFPEFKKDCLAIQDGGSFVLDPTQPAGATS